MQFYSIYETNKKYDILGTQIRPIFSQKSEHILRSFQDQDSKTSIVKIIFIFLFLFFFKKKYFLFFFKKNKKNKKNKKK